MNFKSEFKIISIGVMGLTLLVIINCYINKGHY